MGVPVLNEDGSLARWDPPAPFTNAPWLAFDFKLPDQRLQYMEAIKNYALSDMVPHDFVPQNNKLGKKHWYHVPMMTAGNNPREPIHGVTQERALRASEQAWLTANVAAFGIGYYNHFGGYTIGQVFRDSEPSNSDPSKGQFIDGTVVFKLLFAEHVPSAIVPGNNPLENAPEWQIQDPTSEGGETFAVRLIQMDIAVKDPRSTVTGWVFATYVYDKSLPAATPEQRWYNLTPVGLQWGNDYDVTSAGDPDLDESWINPDVPAPFAGHIGLHGRLNGPVDNPASACMSCHSTAQVRTNGGSFGAYKAVAMVPDPACTPAQKQQWFRSLAGSEPFGATTGANFCSLTSPPLGSPPMYALDYSLQLQLALAHGVGADHPNPCMSSIPPNQTPAAIEQAWRDAFSRDSDRVQREAEFARPQEFEAQKFSRAQRRDLPTWEQVGGKAAPAKVPLGETPETWAIAPRASQSR